MTIETIIGMSADELEKMSLQDLEAFCAPFLDVTRPDRPSAVHKDTRKGTHKGNGMDDRQLKFASLSEEKQRILKELMAEGDLEL
jgi:hypothetical protein